MWGILHPIGWWTTRHQDIIQLNIAAPSDKKKEKPTKDVFEKEDKDKSKKNKYPEKCCSEVLVKDTKIPLE